MVSCQEKNFSFDRPKYGIPTVALVMLIAELGRKRARNKISCHEGLN
jgi:hypothetical protein